MKILVIGCNGNMGRRYCAILKWLGIEHVGIDIPMPYDWLSMDWDRAIIATPTDTHVDIIAMMDNRPWLCEKPITKQIGLMEGIALQFPKNGYMVNNWRFVSELSPKEIHYNFYNTGKDGTAWDCIQLIHLARGNVKIETTSPVFNCKFIYSNKHIRQITTDDVAMSYVYMIKAFVTDDTKYLWTMQDALAATKGVIEYVGTHPSA